MIVLLILPNARPGTCGRCKKPVPDTEICWFCQGDLCGECWEEHGHCGHEEADRFNAASRMLDTEGRHALMDTFLHGRN